MTTLTDKTVSDKSNKITKKYVHEKFRPTKNFAQKKNVQK